MGVGVQEAGGSGPGGVGMPEGVDPVARRVEDDFVGVVPKEPVESNPSDGEG